MRKKSTFIRSLTLLVTIIMAFTQKTNAQSATAISEVSNAVEALKKAMIQADSTALDRLTFFELSYGHSHGNVQNRQEFIQSFTSHESVFVSIDISDQTIKVIDNIAIVRHSLFAKTNDKGKGPGTVKLAILLVWKKNDEGKWQLLARQAVRL